MSVVPGTIVLEPVVLRARIIEIAVRELFRQRSLVELREFFHVRRTRADQQFVDAGPYGRAIALAARLRAGGEDETGTILVEPETLQALLRENDQVIYLDPDTYVTSPMDELGPALDASAGIVLTPHYLQPTPPGPKTS